MDVAREDEAAATFNAKLSSQKKRAGYYWYTLELRLFVYIYTIYMYTIYNEKKSLLPALAAPFREAHTNIYSPSEALLNSIIVCYYISFHFKFSITRESETGSNLFVSITRLD